MAQNTSPIYTLVPVNSWVQSITAANTAKDGTGTVSTVFTANATNGGYVSFVRFAPLGTNVTTVGRIFINNGSTNATASNNVMFAQISLPATTNIETQSLPTFDVPINIALAPGYKLNVVLGTAVSAGFSVSAHGGDY